MAKKRGLLAELHHQSQLAAKERERKERQTAKAYADAEKRRQRAIREAERAAVRAEKAAAAEQKKLEAELKAAHIELKNAEVDELNAQLDGVNEEIDSLLASTLAVDDFVDLETLRAVAEHPPFPRPDLETPNSPPAPIPEPPEPAYQPPPKVGGLIGKKKKQAEAEERARQEFELAHERWQTEMSAIPGRNERSIAEFEEAEAKRLEELAAAQALYQEECAERERAVEAQNAQLDQLIANLGYGTPEAIEEYVSIVLANSIYPESFDIEYDFSFQPTGAELTLQVIVPKPDTLPTVKAYKYVKAADEIRATDLSQKAQKDRYAGAIHQVTLRTVHEVFEADRRGLIKSISLQVGTEAPDPATGQPGFVPFTAVAAERDSFMTIELADVVPAATLDHLGASVSKNPFGLVPAKTTGVRRS